MIAQTPRAAVADGTAARAAGRGTRPVCREGFAAARTEEIASRAGVSKGTLYLYFPSKHDLLEALIAEGFSSHIAIEAHETTDDRASHELLRDVLTAWRPALIEGDAGGILKLVYTEARNFPGLADLWSSEVIEPVRRLVSGIVVRGIDRGEFRPVDPDVVVHALVLPMVFMCLHRHAVGLQVLLDSLTGVPDLSTRHFEFVLEGLIHRPLQRRG